MVLKHLHLASLEFCFLAKTSKERIDSEKVFRIIPKHKRRNSEKHRMQFNNVIKFCHDTIYSI